MENIIAKFSDYDINELEEALQERKIKLCNVSTIENMNELVEEIEALEFLIQKAEIDG
jgi:hypothetical protein